MIFNVLQDVSLLLCGEDTTCSSSRTKSAELVTGSLYNIMHAFCWL